MRTRLVAPLLGLVLLAGCGGGGDGGDSVDSGTSADRPAGASAGDIIITPSPVKARADLAAALKPLLKAKSTACAVSVLSDVQARAWFNVTETLMDADISLKSAMALQTADLRKKLGLAGKDLSGQRIKAQVVILKGQVTELRIAGTDLQSGLEAAGIAMDTAVSGAISSLQQDIEYVVSQGSVTVKAPKSVVGSGPCPSA